MKSYGVPAGDRHTLPPGRTAFGHGVSVVDGTRADNPKVTSKFDRSHGEPRKPQAAELHRDPVNPDSPITHHGGPPMRHVETVGHIPNTGGEFRRVTTPNADSRTGTDRVFTHAPLKPVGQTHSKTGGEHGEPQTVPARKGNGGASARGNKGSGGALNAPRDRNR